MISKLKLGAILSIIVIFGSLAASGATNSKVALKNLDSYLFDQNDIGKRKGKRTDSALVIQDGKVIYERYERGYGPHKKHIMWSTSKTAMALLMGVAEKDHLATRDQSICDFLKSLRPDLCKIRIRDLLQWSSGLKWREEYENASTPRMSSVVAMLYGEGRKDMAQFALSHPFEEGTAPGKMWRYSSGDSIILAAVLKEIYHGQDLRSVYREKLYGPLGMKDWLWEADDAGTLSGGYYFFVSAPDLAKLGQIFLSGGVVNGKKIMDRSFLNFMESIPPAFITDRRDHNSHHMPGAHLWINRSDVKEFPQPWPYAPSDTIMTMGHWGQFMIVSPSLKLIAVRTGDTRDHSFSTDRFVSLVMGVARPEKISEVGSPSPMTAEEHSEKGSRLYQDGIMKLGLRFTAHAFCSCLFVSANTEDACRAFASLEQVSPRLTVDFTNKETKSTLFFLFSAKAKYLGPEKGCLLE